MRATVGQERYGIALAAKRSHRVSRQFLGWRIALEDGRRARVDAHVANGRVRRPGHLKGRNVPFAGHANVVLFAQGLEMGNVRLQLALNVAPLQNNPTSRRAAAQDGPSRTCIGETRPLLLASPPGRHCLGSRSLWMRDMTASTAAFSMDVVM